MTKKIFITAFFFVLVLATNAQTNRCGLPNYTPTTKDNHSFIDICSGGEYLFEGGKWYRQGTISSNTAPQIEFTNVGVTISNIRANWENATTKVMYDAAWNGTVYVWTAAVNIDIRPLNNTFTGTNLFTDFVTTQKVLTAQKGVNSDSTITSNGGATTAAVFFKGVLSMRDTTITSNYTATGQYGRIIVDCTAGDITVTLPAPVTDNAGWCYEFQKKGVTVGNVRLIQGAFSHTLISPDKMIKVRQKGGFWAVD